jgi:hypothetical protein
MNVKEEVKVENDFSLSVYLMTLRSLYPEVDNYKQQAHLMYEEFGLEVSEDELYELENQRLPEENKYTLIYKNLGL